MLIRPARALWLAIAALLLLPPLPARADVGPPTIAAHAWALIDGNTGQLLSARNPDTKQYPASTTKILTALVAAEHGKLTDRYTVTPAAVDLPWDSTVCELNAGEQQSLEALLHGLLLPSGNDCALAIAIGQAGSEAGFATWMNDRAATLGATHSHFSNPHGLHSPDLYTTAHDLAIIARGAFGNPDVRRIASAPTYTMPGHEAMINHDSLLQVYPDVVAGKNGFTEQAGATLVIAARRGDRYLIGVILGEQAMSHTFQDMISLLDYGFQSFHALPAVQANQSFPALPVAAGTLGSVDVSAAAGFAVSVEASRNSLPAEVRVVPRGAANLAAPINPGQVVGEADVLLGQQLLGSVPLVAARGVEATAVRANVSGAAAQPAWQNTVTRWGLYSGLLAVGLLVLAARRARRRHGRRYGRRLYPNRIRFRG